MDNLSFLDDLNSQQKEICIDENNILLKACPGSWIFRLNSACFPIKQCTHFRFIVHTFPLNSAHLRHIINARKTRLK